MKSPLHVPGPWRSIDALTSSDDAGFRFTGNLVPLEGGDKGYELTAETAFAAADSVEWMHDPVTGKLFPWADEAYQILRNAVGLKGLSGNDEAVGSGFDDIFRMGAGADSVYGRWGNDFIDGGAGDDALYGEQGDDTFIGGSGNDALVGGAGIDLASYAGSSAGFRHLFTVVGSLTSEIRITGFGAAAAAHGMDTLRDIEAIEFADGWLVFDEGSAAAVVYRMYDALFARAPDALGFHYWTGALEHGTNVEGMASFFAASPEFAGRYGALGNQGFVEQLYQNVLGRAGEASGVAFWTGELDSGRLARGQVLAGFSESGEHKDLLRPQVQAGLWDLDDAAAQAARVYAAAFDRNPDAAGLAFWTSGLKSGTQTAAAMTGFFVQSAEFAAKYGALSNAQFVDRLYHNVLDRAGDSDGTAFWTHALDAGTYNRGSVLLGFAESAENVSKTLPTMTNGILLA